MKSYKPSVVPLMRVNIDFFKNICKTEPYIIITLKIQMCRQDATKVELLVVKYSPQEKKIGLIHDWKKAVLLYKHILETLIHFLPTIALRVL